LRLPETPEKDPVVTNSVAGYLFIAAVLLLGSLAWALWQEFFGLRPWKDYERQFVARYSRYLHKEIPLQEQAEKDIENSADYKRLQREYQDLEESIKPKREGIESQTALLDARMSRVLDRLTDVRSQVAAREYSIEHSTTDPAKKHSLEDEELKPLEETHYNLTLQSLAGPGQFDQVTLNFQGLENELNRLQAMKAELQTQEGDLLRPLSEKQKQIDDYLHTQLFVQNRLNGLTVDQLKGLVAKMEIFTIDIKQINNPDAELVDRCESCHVGIQEPLKLTPADLPNSSGKADRMSAAFVSHPDMELLRIHDPARFGCSPCHNGNGMQVDSATEGHGEYEHWLWPLYHKGANGGPGNMEAGCQQCHTSDMVLAHAPVLSQGKELFQWRGCMGCHRFQGYDPEPEDLSAIQQRIQQLEQERANDQHGVDRANHLGDNASDNETARRYYLQANELRVAISKIDQQVDLLDNRSGDVLRDMKKVGPDLKEVRAKIRPEWLPVWLTNPHAWRPTTKMPRFRLDEDDVKEISAFIWQSGLDAKLPTQPMGDPKKGEESFKTRGCRACHSIGEGAEQVGGWFAANLTRVGEKDNYDYLVRWVHNPRERSAPYCPYEKRDLTPADYRKHGLPFVFDLEHNRCPNDGHVMQVEQMTAMPNLRLSIAEARDIAAYVETLKRHEPASYTKVPWINDPKLAAEGRKKVQFYGCAGCHEIAGLETEGRVGTELTKEGSKPFEQLDFGLHVEDARDHDWYNHRGFFEHKLARPEVYDDGYVTKTESEQARMPDFFEPMHDGSAQPVSELNSEPVPEGKKWNESDLSGADQEQVNALTTFLLGAVSSKYPERYFYLPPDQRRDIQEGWWVVKKYNCMGCHQFTLDQESVVMNLPQYQTPEGKGELPPRLVTEGARVNPEWLAKFLANPSLSDTDTDRDGVRSYLKIRMPTFFFSPVEIRKLVRFFQALSSQPMPYIPRKLEPLSTAELEMARALFTSQGAPCLKCHAIGLAEHDKNAIAPNFLLAPERLKPDWVRHWILDPSMIDPGTNMPSNLFRHEGARWVFAGPTPPSFKGYSGDHTDLLVRYMFEINPAEQQRLIQMTGGNLKSKAASTTHLAPGPGGRKEKFAKSLRSPGESDDRRPAGSSP
jgi:cytochrome c551/c552